jgi:hypothetical protein
MLFVPERRKKQGLGFRDKHPNNKIIKIKRKRP